LFCKYKDNWEFVKTLPRTTPLDEGIVGGVAEMLSDGRTRVFVQQTLAPFG
jgi:hypothetical protein